VSWLGAERRRGARRPAARVAAPGTPVPVRARAAKGAVRAIIGAAYNARSLTRPRRGAGPHPSMSKAFTREDVATQDDGDDDLELPPLPAGTRNYMTPGGFARLKAELDQLVGRERPELVATVAWAASNGDRSENGDYLYGKKRLREVDRRIRFLIKRLDQAEVVDPAAPRDAEAAERVYFGATVTIRDRRGAERRLSIVGIDEADTAKGHVSWISPVARALLRASSSKGVPPRPTSRKPPPSWTTRSAS
jgi:transcription elongation factor GreB